MRSPAMAVCHNGQSSFTEPFCPGHTQTKETLCLARNEIANLQRKNAVRQLPPSSGNELCLAGWIVLLALPPLSEPQASAEGCFFFRSSIIPSIFSKAHEIKLLTQGSKERARSVKVYSTRGGTSA